MTIETKKDVFERVLEQKKPVCPHCNVEMSIWEVPPLTFSDGLGWGAPYLYVCFNDDCPPFKAGWDHIYENYAHKASYRCMCEPQYPDRFDFLPVFGPEGGGSQIIDENTVNSQKAVEEAIKTGFATLADCYVNKDYVKILQMLLDSSEPTRVRIKAAQMMGDLADETEFIEPIKFHKYGNQKLQDAADEAVMKIHERCFTRECPYCAEIIKKRAKVCKHCGKDLTQ